MIPSSYKSYKVVLTVLSIVGYSSCLPLSEDPICTAEEIAKYRIVFTGRWSQTAFPKQYPLYRPPAQWSSLLGKSLLHAMENGICIKCSLCMKVIIYDPIDI
ncbi:hypothetical protein GDO78_011502 [Eleutherodactylus coqui]|uniref:Spondin domain-containing protein n=1 Tax=Eleutherodactylus coqui TaxID=57060 RepID=A0A8J6K520_ELECQ|nr:hypothetical protein GDO78_011502 [Eleutherodactylus coqui]